MERNERPHTAAAMAFASKLSVGHQEIDRIIDEVEQTYRAQPTEWLPIAPVGNMVALQWYEDIDEFEDAIGGEFIDAGLLSFANLMRCLVVLLMMALGLGDVSRDASDRAGSGLDARTRRSARDSGSAGMSGASLEVGCSSRSREVAAAAFTCSIARVLKIHNRPERC